MAAPPRHLPSSRTFNILAIPVSAHFNVLYAAYGCAPCSKIITRVGINVNSSLVTNGAPIALLALNPRHIIFWFLKLLKASP